MAMGIDSLQLLFLILLSGLLFLETIKLSSCIEIEKKALLKFKDSLTDPSGQLSSWVGENYCNNASGVTCNNKSGNVNKLNLRNPFPDSSNIHKLGSEINPSLLDLKYLSYLDLSMNDFGGIQIPSFFGSLTKLKYLHLSSSSFGGTIIPNLEKPFKLTLS
ncbi:hypothetical protein CsSME_00037747 [Camellia sinensis var. sinensis]